MGESARSHGFDLVAFGETMALFSPTESRMMEAGGLCRVDAAGAEANVARILALMGAHTAWVSAVGADLLGEIVCEAVRADGVDVSMVTRDAHRPTGAIFKSEGAGERGVQYLRTGSAASAMNTTYLTKQTTHGARYRHVSGVTAALSPSCLDLVDAILSGPRNGSRVSFDVNYRRLLWDHKPSEVLLELARKADLVFVGLDEAESLWGVSRPAELFDLFAQSVDVVVKNSDIDARVFVDGEEWVVPAPPRQVVEAVGAGDAFAAGYLLGEMLSLSPSERLALGHEVAGVVLGISLDTPSKEDLAHLPKVER